MSDIFRVKNQHITFKDLCTCSSKLRCYIDFCDKLWCDNTCHTQLCACCTSLLWYKRDENLQIFSWKDSLSYNHKNNYRKTISTKNTCTLINNNNKMIFWRRDRKTNCTFWLLLIIYWHHITIMKFKNKVLLLDKK